MLRISIYDVVGVIGGCLILFGFYRTSIGRWKNKSFWYEMDNFIGAVLLSIYQLNSRSYISVVLNVIWATVAFRGLTSFGERYEKAYFKNQRAKKRRKT